MTDVWEIREELEKEKLEHEATLSHLRDMTRQRDKLAAIAGELNSLQGHPVIYNNGSPVAHDPNSCYACKIKKEIEAILGGGE